MGCLAQVSKCFYSTLEQWGIYEPQIEVEEAKDRLKAEKERWAKFQDTANSRGTFMQANRMTIDPLLPLVQKAVTHLKSHHIEQGIAVDLGCGMNPRSFQLLEQGWKVYAVDYSDSVIQVLRERMGVLGKQWIENGQLVFLHESIETFEYPENVHLIIAIDSLPYCDPEKIHSVFLKGKNALLPQGMFVGTLLPYSDRDLTNNVFREIGLWMTTKNVVQAILRSVDFPSWVVLDGRTPAGIGRQFHVFAEQETHDVQSFKEIYGEDEEPEPEIVVEYMGLQTYRQADSTVNHRSLKA